MNNNKILLSVSKFFISWRLALFLIAFLATYLITGFGGRFPYADRVLTVTGLPSWVWGFGNFDGVHYLRIAQNGYTADFSQAFFPLYPHLIRIFNIFPKGNLNLNYYTDPSYFYTGMILSAIFFVAGLYFLIKLWTKEYNSKVAFISVLLLITFPTSFYYGAVYSESLFLLLTVLTFWFVRKDKFLPAGITAMLASATKVQGVLLGLFLAVELWEKYKGKFKNSGKKLLTDILGIIISPLGLLGYMLYLYKTFADPVLFLTVQPAFGADRSSVPLVTLPQVIYRYIKMLLTVDPGSISFWNAALELSATLVVIAALIYTFKKIKFSYWIFVLTAIILPTMTGTFSSMPRYMLLAFPLLPVFVKKVPAGGKGRVYTIIAQVLLGIVLIALFTRGYWVA